MVRLGYELGWGVGCACCECSEYWEWLNTLYMDALSTVNARNG